MSKVYAYCLSIPGPDQRALIDRFCAERGYVLSGTFEDDAGARDIAWLARPAGVELAAELMAGDEVVVAGMASVYSSRREVLNSLRWFHERGIAVHFAVFAAKFPVPISLRGAMPDLLIQTLDTLVRFDSSVRSEAIREGLRARRIRAKRYTNFPPCGYKWQYRRGEQRCVPDEHERSVIAEIIELRNQGHSWESIAVRLLRRRVVTAAGQEWSPSRVRRAYLAARRLAGSNEGGKPTS